MGNQIWSPSAVGPIASRHLRLFALNGTDDLGRDISKLLAHPLSAHEERDFEDGEHKARPLDPVGGADVYVIHSLHGGPDQSANDKLCRLLFFIGALKDAGAKRLTAVADAVDRGRRGFRRDRTQSALERLGGEKSIEIVPGATHLVPEPGALETVIEFAAGWFEHHLVVDPASANRSAGQ